MATGFFLGGMAQGESDARKQSLAELTQAQDFGLRSRGLDIQEQTLRRAEGQDAIKRGDELIANTMSSVAETVKAGITAGRDPATVLQAVTPMVESAKAIAAKVGRDPRSLDAQVSALIQSPTASEAGRGAGIVEGTKEGTKQKTIDEILGGEAGAIRDPVKKAEVENKLRDDYQKQTKDFTTLRDFKDRMDKAGDTGAGDLTLVFSFMKVLDPTSAVRETEYANAANASGVYEQIRNLWNRVKDGDKLSPKAREEIRAEAANIWQKATERQSSLTNQYIAISKRTGINPKNVIVDPIERDNAMSTTPGGTRFRIIP